MKAIQITRLDGPEAVELVEIDEPVAGEGQVLIAVKASGVSFPEVLQTRGLYQMKPPVPFTPGSEVAGDVIAAGESTGFKPGDRVIGFTLLGGFAEKAVVQADMVYPLPDNVSYEQGAAVPLNYLTAYFALVDRGGLAEGESVLVHGAAGGVGTAAIQIAKAFGAGRVIAVTSTSEKGAVAMEAGADEFVLVEDFKDAVKAGGGVDIVVDPVGGD
ncbi:MAG: alcohol dehydrogenase catalytic domain-containing protein, partial [Aeromicrobium sp.]